MIVILDAGISAEDDSSYFNDAQDNDALIRSSINTLDFDGTLSAKVWANHTVFLDFWDEDAKRIWADGLKDLYDKVPYDGLWLDMNEATTFCDGECPKGSDDYTNSTPYDGNSWFQSNQD